MCNFMSNRLFQAVIHQMKDAIDKTFGVIDANNTIIACSELVRIGEQLDLSVIPTTEGFTDGILSSSLTIRVFLFDESFQFILLRESPG